MSRYDSYHGATMGAAAAGGGASRKSPHEPHLSGFLKVPQPLFLRDRLDWTWEEVCGALNLLRTHVDLSLAHINMSLAHLNLPLAHINISLAHLHLSLAQINMSLARMNLSLAHSCH